MLRLILKENSFQFNGKHYVQIHGTAMGTKMAVSFANYPASRVSFDLPRQGDSARRVFANIFMAKIETEILSKSVFKPTVWKRYIDDIYSLWEISKPDIEAFRLNKQIHGITQLSNSRPISHWLWDCVPRHGYIQRQQIQGTIDPWYKNTFKPTETFQYTHFTSCHPPSVKNGFVKAGRMPKNPQNKLLESYFWQEHLKLQETLARQGLPSKSNRQNPVRNRIHRKDYSA